MIELGKTYSLEIITQVDFGLYLDGQELGRAAVVDPAMLLADPNQRTPEALTALFGDLSENEFLLPARANGHAFVSSTLAPASPLVHYHVLLEAPGGAGSQVAIGLEVLDQNGRPQPPGGDGFAPFHGS